MTTRDGARGGGAADVGAAVTLDDVVTMLLAEAIERAYSAVARRADAADDEIPALYAAWRTAYNARRSATTRAECAGWVYR